MKKWGALTVRFLFLSFLFPAIIQGQAKQDESFATLPVEIKQRLFARLNSYVEYRRNLQWDKVYDLYWKRYVSAANGLKGISKEKYVERYHRAHRSGGDNNLVRFTPLNVRVVSLPKEEWLVVIVEGCGEYRKYGAKKQFGRDVNWKSSVTMFYENGEWFLQDIEIGPRCLGCPPEKCKMN